MISYLKVWLASKEKGQDLAEYALLIAIAAVLVIAALIAIGGNINTLFQALQTALDSAVTAI
jgi:pilus assembly protein Flp/PilA